MTIDRRNSHSQVVEDSDLYPATGVGKVYTPPIGDETFMQDSTTVASTIDSPQKDHHEEPSPIPSADEFTPVLVSSEV